MYVVLAGYLSGDRVPGRHQSGDVSTSTPGLAGVADIQTKGDIPPNPPPSPIPDLDYTTCTDHVSQGDTTQVCIVLASYTCRMSC